MADSTYFTPETFAFLKQLKRNNDRDWFAKNKSRYEEHVVAPALAFIRDFAPHLEKISPHFLADARPTRGSLFRIYRDIRFSHDKRPFKTHAGMHFAHAKGKDAHAPGFYLHLEPGQCFAGGGLWHPDNPALTKLRTAIVRESEQWAKATKKLTLEGEKLSRPPRGFDPNHPFVEDLKRKDFVVSTRLTDEQVCSGTFLRDYVAVCRKATPLIEFTTRALGMKF